MSWDLGGRGGTQWGAIYLPWSARPEEVRDSVGLWPGLWLPPPKKKLSRPLWLKPGTHLANEVSWHWGYPQDFECAFSPFCTFAPLPQSCHRTSFSGNTKHISPSLPDSVAEAQRELVPLYWTRRTCLVIWGWESPVRCEGCMRKQVKICGTESFPPGLFLAPWIHLCSSCWQPRT